MKYADIEGTLNAMLIAVLCIHALNALLAITLNIWLFCVKRENERPTFVVMQIFCFNIFCICFGGYLSMIYYRFKHGDELEDFTSNAFATIGDTFYYIYGWLFI